MNHVLKQTLRLVYVSFMLFGFDPSQVHRGTNGRGARFVGGA